MLPYFPTSSPAMPVHPRALSRSVGKRDRRAVAGECEMRGARRTPRSGGPSCNDPDATGWRYRILGDSAVTPCQAARRCQGPQRWVTNSAHRGSCGASHKTPRAGRRMKTDLRFQTTDGRRSLAGPPLRSGVARGRSPEVRSDPGVPRALGPFPNGASTSPRAKNRAAAAADALRCHGVDAQIHYSSTQWSAVSNCSKLPLPRIQAIRRKWANWPVARPVGLSYHFDTFQR